VVRPALAATPSKPATFHKAPAKKVTAGGDDWEAF
jgi:hypothetical protein